MDEAKDTKKQITFKLERSTVERLAKMARTANCTQASIVDDALREYLLQKDDSPSINEAIEYSLETITRETEKVRKRVAMHNATVEERKQKHQQRAAENEKQGEA